MSTETVHFFKITGRLADEFEAACEAVRRRKPAGTPGSRGSDDWHGRDRARIDHLGQALLAMDRVLPAVWYSQFVSGYAWGWAAEPHGGWPDGVTRSLYSANTNIAYFPAAVMPLMLARVKRMRRPSAYDLHLRSAIEANDWAKGRPLVVVVSRCLGGSWDDADVHAAANASLRPWLKQTRERFPPPTDGRAAAGFRRQLQNLTRRIAKP